MKSLLVLKQKKSRLYFGAKLLLGSLALILVESLPLNHCEFPSKSLSTSWVQGLCGRPIIATTTRNKCKCFNSKCYFIVGFSLCTVLDLKEQDRENVLNILAKAYPTCDFVSCGVINLMRIIL